MYKRGFFSKVSRLAGLLLLLGVVGGCASGAANGPDEAAEFERINDPFEPVNRQVFAVNVALDTFVLQPVAVTYRDFMFPPLKNNVSALLTNLRLPWTFVNNLLQGDFGGAEQTASRFVSNIVFLWMADVGPGDPDAVDGGQEDFGQTLAVWGVRDGGPYIMLPILGPSNLRDTGGRVVDFVADPIGLISSTESSVGRAGTRAVDERSRNIEQVQDLQYNSLDYYATVRSLYRQRREALIENAPLGTTGPAPSISLSDDFE